MPGGDYITAMMRAPAAILLLALIAVVAAPAAAQTGGYSILGDDYNIMVPEKGAKPKKPEPWLAPKYKSPRGTLQHVVTPRPAPVPSPREAVPPTLYVPETGRTLPNLPTVSGSGLRGAETYQDRAARCAHQAGVYGQAAGNPGAYIGSCINQ